MKSIRLTASEIQSGSDRQKWAEGLIQQLPKDHDGRNSWLMNYGRSEEAKALREYNGGHQFNTTSQAINPPAFPEEFDMVQMVENFHRHFNIAYDGKPRALDFETSTFRIGFMREETNEYEKHSQGALFELNVRAAGNASDDANLNHHLAEMLDALIDQLYVTLGTAHLQGFDVREAFLRVHRANMAKVANPVAANADEARKMKISKPEGWKAPDHTDLIENNAHKI